MRIDQQNQSFCLQKFSHYCELLHSMCFGCRKCFELLPDYESLEVRDADYNSCTTSQPLDVYGATLPVEYNSCTNGILLDVRLAVIRVFSQY